MKITMNNIDDVFRAGTSSIKTMELTGYELIDEIMVDNSGFGSPDEYADTPEQFKTRLRVLLDEHGKLTAKITGIGQFQVYVGLFTKTGTKQAKRIASNVLLIDKGDGKRIVRLYDTDILTDNGDGTLTVDNGGYATRTTHKRINEFSTLMANAKNFETYINGHKLSERNTFEGGLRV